LNTIVTLFYFLNVNKIRNVTNKCYKISKLTKNSVFENGTPCMVFITQFFYHAQRIILATVFCFGKTLHKAMFTSTKRTSC